MGLDLDRDRISTVVDAVANRLPGDWLLVGGALVALWLEPRRMTEDVDLVSVPGSGSDRLQLLGLAKDLGLPVEALNSAADYFVYRIADWRQQIELFREGATGHIFRPTPTLFLLLKLSRLSDQDLADCLSLLERVRSGGLVLDAGRVATAIAALAPPGNDDARSRRDRLTEAVAQLGAE